MNLENGKNDTITEIEGKMIKARICGSCNGINWVGINEAGGFSPEFKKRIYKEVKRGKYGAVCRCN